MSAVTCGASAGDTYRWSSSERPHVPIWPQPSPVPHEQSAAADGGAATRVFASTRPSEVDRGQQRVGPREVRRVLAALGHVEVPAEDHPRPVGRVEQRQQVGDDPVHRAERGPLEHAVHRDDGDRLDPGHGHPRDGGRARVRGVEQVPALGPRVADRADGLDGDRLVKGDHRGPPVAVPSQLPVHGPLAGTFRRAARPPGRARPARRSPRRGGPRRPRRVSTGSSGWRQWFRFQVTTRSCVADASSSLTYGSSVRVVTAGCHNPDWSTETGALLRGLRTSAACRTWRANEAWSTSLGRGGLIGTCPRSPDTTKVGGTRVRRSQRTGSTTCRSRREQPPSSSYTSSQNAVSQHSQQRDQPGLASAANADPPTRPMVTAVLPPLRLRAKPARLALCRCWLPRFRQPCRAT